MATSTTILGRRAFLRSATAAATLTTAGLATATPATADDRHRSHAPRTVALPRGLQPEGITSGPGTRYYVGSLVDGRVVTGDLVDGTSRVLLPGAKGRSLRGLQWDRRSGLVWAAASLGTAAHVYAVSARTGAIVHDARVPGGVFLNDLVVTRRAVWVTDSNKDRLAKVPLGRHGAPTGAAPTFLALGGDWPGFNGSGINANGIRELPDGSLVLNNSRVGGLWQVDPETGSAQEIPVSGGPRITSGDGLELDGSTLYNVRGTGGNEVAALRLRHRHGQWRARWVDDLTDSTLDVPSTATVAGCWLWAVNARFGVAAPDTADYWVTRLPTR